LNFGEEAVGSTSSEQTYTVEGSNLTNDISLIAPAGFNISTTSGSGFNSSLTLTQTGGIIATTTIYVHFEPTEIHSYSGDITHISSGASQVNVSLTGNCSTGISENEITNEEINIYPNPSKGMFKIDIKGHENSSLCVIVNDINGNIILKKLFNNSVSNTIDLTGNSSGIYFLQITIDNKILTTQVVIK